MFFFAEKKHVSNASLAIDSNRLVCGQKDMESAGKYSKSLNVFAFRGGGARIQRRLLAFFQFANSVTFRGHCIQEKSF